MRQVVTADRPQPDGLTQVVALSLNGYAGAIDSLRQTLLIGGVAIVALEAAIA